MSEVKSTYDVHITKGIRVSDTHYTIDLDHAAICKLQGLLVLAYNASSNNPWPGSDPTDDKAFCRQFDDAIMAARQQGTPT